MMAFNDAGIDIDEQNDARMHFRTKARIKSTIQQAAALSGVDDTAFTINAAYQLALATIAAHQRTQLHAVDHEAFFEALDNAPAPTQKLQDAFARHAKTVISK